ncbi:integral membrane protein YfiB [Klebsiella pneumoniae subsp. ozaenae]|uniref:Integral membrane protein YfiB n=1 Tax=Klebsiella pneumoniae subsp. ozaenae TaxID=574 RepID=A0A378AB81_KLEPO|nr:integral membrane protein YfiB [Klebsiella pneumoniae subsp. ozaenae]
MIRKYFVPALMAAALLTGCQAPQGKFTPEQVAAMKSYGFTESNGDWSLGLSDSILFDKNDYRLRPDSRQQITTMASRLAATGITIAALKAIPIIMVKIATMKPCRLSGPTAWPMPGAEGAHVPRSNLVTRGLGKKYPIASNDTAAGRAENRRVTVVISTP